MDRELQSANRRGGRVPRAVSRSALTAATESDCGGGADEQGDGAGFGDEGFLESGNRIAATASAGALARIVWLVAAVTEEGRKGDGG